MTESDVRRPDFFIVGAPKSGTTALYFYLREHPDIFMARKELHQFGSDLTMKGYRDQRTIDEYLTKFAGASSAKRVGEASVAYLVSERAADEIHAFNSDAQIIIMLRNPVDVMYSLFKQLQYDGIEHLQEFEEALAAEPDRAQGRRIRDTYGIRDLLRYRHTVSFSTQVERYLTTFGPERVQIVLFDDFKVDDVACLQGVLGFLGLDHSYAPDPVGRVNTNKVIRSQRVKRVHDFITESKALHSLNNAMFPQGRRRSRAKTRFLEWFKEANTAYVPREPMNPALRERLVSEFAPEVTRLGELIGRDLEHWSRSRVSG